MHEVLFKLVYKLFWFKELVTKYIIYTTGTQSLIMLSTSIFDSQLCVCIRCLARSFLVTIPMTCTESEQR